MKQIKNYLKKNKFFVKIYNYLFMRPIVNLYKKQNIKRALLSYSVYPFKKKSEYRKHTNYVENYVIAEILDNNGYNVDIYNNSYNLKINYSKYDLIIGEGMAISKYFYSRCSKKIKTIYYATGCHPLYNNNNSYKSLIKFYHKFGVWNEQFSRIVDYKWVIGASLSDEIIIIGNEVTKKSFDIYNEKSKKNILNPIFYPANIITDFSKKDKNKFLWFGSFGLVHKGLDTVLDYFLENENLELYVCGYLEVEKEFVNLYRSKMDKNKNIKFCGFIDLKSEKFCCLMEECSFVILTSVAEGCSTAVLTAMGNGGLIPIITQETGVDVNLGYEVKENNVQSLNTAVKETQKLSKEEIASRAKQLIKYSNENFLEEHFKNNLVKILNRML